MLAAPGEQVRARLPSACAREPGSPRTLILFSRRTRALLGQVDGSFSHSLLRIVPYDDCPVLAPADPSSPAAHAFNTPNPAENGRLTAAAASRAFDEEGGILRGGDVARLCHLSSTGFLTHEAVSTSWDPEADDGGSGGGGRSEVSTPGMFPRSGAMQGERNASLRVPKRIYIFLRSCAYRAPGLFPTGNSSRGGRTAAATLESLALPLRCTSVLAHQLP